MTGGFGFDSATWAVQAWERIGEHMSDARRELSAAETDGLPPAVVHVAGSFLSTWQRLAGESEGLAGGFVSALHSTDSAYRGVDSLTVEELAKLDGRLGPGR